MEYRRLGNSGLKVSPICLGAMMFGDQTDEAAAGRIVDSAFGAGINFIDTADSYAKGGSERMVGKLIAKNRELMGATDPKKATAGTIRADFADSIDANAVHGSDGAVTAEFEIEYFFAQMNIYSR